MMKPIKIGNEIDTLREQARHFHLNTDVESVWAGNHVLFDFKDGRMPSMEEMELLMGGAAVAAGATILASNFHPFEGGGYTGILVLSESHFSVHVWPEIQLATFDAYMCGDAVPKKVFTSLLEIIEPKQYSFMEIRRGVMER